MTSFGDAVRRLEDALFVGRERELSAFRQWLLDDSVFPVILNVNGPGGVGKSTLLRAFGRVAAGLDRGVVYVDGCTCPASAESLLAALDLAHPDGTEGNHDPRAVIARLNAARPVVMVDGFEELADLTGFLVDEFLPQLGTDVRLVIAGRQPLGLIWSQGAAWQMVVRRLALEGFSDAESRAYLRRRGLDDPILVERVLEVGRGNPLALSLAADLALHIGVRDFQGAPEWRLVVHGLAERLMRDVRDPHLRHLLEACTVVRQFDEATLSAISGQEDAGDAFARLCSLSVVRPTEHGLMLHDDVRRWLTEDLRWRQPARFHALRARALAYYRERLHAAPAHEREWLVAERFFLWGNALIQELFFDRDEPGYAWVDPGRTEHWDDLRRLYAQRFADRPDPEMAVGAASVPAGDQAFLEALLTCPATRLRVARDGDGRVLGFSTVLPVCRDTLPLLDLHPAFAPLVHALWTPPELASLPGTAEEARHFYLLHVVHSTGNPGPVRSALLRDLVGLFALGAVYLSATPLPAYKKLLGVCGFEVVPAARNCAFGEDHPVDGYVLDLTRVGFEPWIQAVMNGGRPLDEAAFESSLQDALLSWHDDDRLARSALTRALASTAPATTAGQAQGLREAIGEALAEARARATPDEELAYRALVLAYLGEPVTSKQAARELAVSRATFYRLARRGLQGLAAALREAAW